LQKIKYPYCVKYHLRFLREEAQMDVNTTMKETKDKSKVVPLNTMELLEQDRKYSPYSLTSELEGDE
jgi:hypothetical protein